jgi:hypothetical protein
MFEQLQKAEVRLPLSVAQTMAAARELALRMGRPAVVAFALKFPLECTL